MINNEQQHNIYNVNEIRKNANASIDCGAVTETYALDLKQTYQLLNEALAGEAMCVLRYKHHQIIAKGIDFPQVAAEFKEHAETEEVHLMMIAERIDQLGGDPDFSPKSILTRSPTEYGSPAGASLETLIREDLVAERVVIDIYKKMINYFGDKDPTTRRMFESILEDEEEHASDLADLLAKV